MARPKGSGVIKFIDPAKQSFVAIRNGLHAGTIQPPFDRRAWLLFRWQELNALHEAAAKRLKGAKRRQELKQLEKAINTTWRNLALAWRGLSGNEFERVLSTTLQMAKQASERPVFGWQQAATRCVEIANLLDGDDDKPNSARPQGETVKLTARQLDAQIRATGCGGFTLHDLRRFVRNSLHATLRPERGRRNDLGRKTYR